MPRSEWADAKLPEGTTLIFAAEPAPAPARERIEDLLGRMRREEDIRRVVYLAEKDGVYKYLIETPFETFPRYVVGATDFEFTRIRHLMKCFADWGAQEWWEEHLEDPIKV